MCGSGRIGIRGGRARREGREGIINKSARRKEGVEQGRAGSERRGERERSAFILSRGREGRHRNMLITVI